MSRLATAAAALPAVLVGVLSLAVLVLSAAGANPVWAVKPITMAEAAALRDPSALARMLQLGRDPYQPAAVREGVFTDALVTVTPLDAAIATRRGEVVQFLVWAAPPRGEAEWTHALCLAALIGDKNVTAVLEQKKPASTQARCDGFTRPW